MKKIIFAAIMVLFSITMAFAATNYVQEGDVLTLTWATTSPESGDPVVKGTASATGGIVGVAITGTGTAAESVAVQTSGVFTLPVKAVSNPIVAGDYIYTTITDINHGVASLTNVATGLKFGKALEGLVTASNTQNIKVFLYQH